MKKQINVPSIIFQDSMKIRHGNQKNSKNY